MSGELGMEVYFKKEILQVTGSFKERGAACAILRLTQVKSPIKYGLVENFEKTSYLGCVKTSTQYAVSTVVF